VRLNRLNSTFAAFLFFFSAAATILGAGQTGLSEMELQEVARALVVNYCKGADLTNITTFESRLPEEYKLPANAADATPLQKAIDKEANTLLPLAVAGLQPADYKLALVEIDNPPENAASGAKAPATVLALAPTDQPSTATDQAADSLDKDSLQAATDKYKSADEAVNEIVSSIKMDAATLADTTKLETKIKEAIQATNEGPQKIHGLDAQSATNKNAISEVSPNLSSDQVKEASTALASLSPNQLNTLAATVKTKIVQAKAIDNAAKVPGFSGVTSGGFNYSSRAALVKLKLIAGDTEIFPDAIKDNHFMGIEVSLTGPAGTESAKDYVTSQLLMRDNGLLNVYFSPFTQNVSQWANWAKIAGLDAPVGNRPTAVNRYYILMSDIDKQLKNFFLNHSNIDPKTGAAVINDQGDPKAFKTAQLAAQEELEKTLVYFEWGLGLKTYKPGIDSGTTRIEGGGTAYLGVGADGGMHDFIGNTEGAWDLEVYAAENTANRRILNQIYNTTKAETTFETICVQFTLSAGPTNLSFFYATPLDRNTRSFAKDMAGLSFSVQQAAKPSVSPSQ
jgi:hypothetical protein